MEFRSTNPLGYTHHGGDFVSNVHSSHGVHLTGGSTGGIVQPAGDDANVTLTLRGLGTGGVVLGNSSSPVTVAGNQSQTGTFSFTGSSFVVAPVSTGGITFGTSSNPVAIAGSSVAVTSTHVNLNSTRIAIGGGASTTALSGITRRLVEFTVPALSSASSAESTVTVAGLTTNAVLILQPRVKLNSTVDGVTITGRCSTADELVVEFHNISQSSLSGSTQSAYLLIFQF